MKVEIEIDIEIDIFGAILSTQATVEVRHGLFKGVVTLGPLFLTKILTLKGNKITN